MSTSKNVKPGLTSKVRKLQQEYENLLKAKIISDKKTREIQVKMLEVNKKLDGLGAGSGSFW